MYLDAVKNELLKNRLVAWSSSDKIKECLILEPDSLTLEQALVLASKVERTSKKIKQMIQTLKLISRLMLLFLVSMRHAVQ